MSLRFAPCLFTTTDTKKEHAKFVRYFDFKSFARKQQNRDDDPYTFHDAHNTTGPSLFFLSFSSLRDFALHQTRHTTQALKLMHTHTRTLTIVIEVLESQLCHAVT